jgi:hypothetical protein
VLFNDVATYKDYIVSVIDKHEEQLVEYCQGKTAVLGKITSQRHFVHHKSYMDWPSIKAEPSLLQPAKRNQQEKIHAHTRSTQKETGLATSTLTTYELVQSQAQ